MEKVKTTVKMALSRDSSDNINLRIKDSHSGDHIIEVCMTLEDLGFLITGRCGVEGAAAVNQDAAIAKKRETVRLEAPRVLGRKDLQREAVEATFFASEYPDLGYSIFDDGTNSQQHGRVHYFMVKRYVSL